ncbi:MAG: hypothetical protein EOO70_02700 [Myxococcaceae bacterium]|nr:MAG: hypothetical protein EOO70_02700 [Myxococcaceae bacterium]
MEMKRLRSPDYQRTDILPPRLEDWLPPHHPARFVRDFLDSLDLEALGLKMPTSQDGGRVVNPKALLAVWLFGWMERVRSTRRLEVACQRDLAFVWLSGGLFPDHNTLWRFWKNHREMLRALFTLQVQMAADAGLVGWALHALDGTKIQAAGSPESAIWRTKLEQLLAKVDTLTEAQMSEVESTAARDPDLGYNLPEEWRDPSARRAFIAGWLKKNSTTSTPPSAKASASRTPKRGTSAGAAGKGGRLTVRSSSTMTAT